MVNKESGGGGPVMTSIKPVPARTHAEKLNQQVVARLKDLPVPSLAWPRTELSLGADAKHQRQCCHSLCFPPRSLPLSPHTPTSEIMPRLCPHARHRLKGTGCSPIAGRNRGRGERGWGGSRDRRDCPRGTCCHGGGTSARGCARPRRRARSARGEARRYPPAPAPIPNLAARR